MTTLADFSDARPAPAAIKAAKCVGVIRYLSEDKAKCITVAEAAGYHAVDLSVALVYEDGAEDFVGGANAGTAKAVIAAKILKALGIPKDRPVYCAIDGGLSLSQYQVAYEGIHAFCSALGRPDAMYGPRPFALWLHETHGVEWFFEAGAASFNTGPEPTSKRIQQLVTRPAGVGEIPGVDYDLALTADWGQWLAAPVPSPTPLEVDMIYTLNPNYLVRGDKKTGIPNPAALDSLRAQGIPEKKLTAEQLGALATVPWGQL
jgi:hypothetical protein